MWSASETAISCLSTKVSLASPQVGLRKTKKCFLKRLIDKQIFKEMQKKICYSLTKFLQENFEIKICKTNVVNVFRILRPWKDLKFYCHFLTNMVISGVNSPNLKSEK